MQQPLGRSLEVDLTLTEAFGVVRTALISAITAAGFYHVGEVDVVVVAHPDYLGLVAAEHFQLLVNMLGHVYVLGGIEVYTCKSVHIVYGHKTGASALGGGVAGMSPQSRRQIRACTPRYGRAYSRRGSG